MIDFQTLFPAPGRRTLCSLPEGYDSLLLARLIEHRAGDFLHICRDDVRMNQLGQAVRFFAPSVEILEFPAWDCVPYDRSSPSPEIVGRRIDTLTRLALPRATGKGKAAPRLVLATVSSVTQRVPRQSVFRRAVFPITAGKETNVDALMRYLARNGYQRVEQVMDAGDYAVRGGLIDLFVPGADAPCRLDFFGDEVDSIRTFDPLTQRTTGTTPHVLLRPVSEVILDDDSISRFRRNYRELFGTVGKNDPLYEAVSEGRKLQGMEHWLPLFHEGMETLFAYLPGAVVSLEYQTDAAWGSRMDLIGEYFDARMTLERRGLDDGGMVYHPIHPERLYLSPEEYERLLTGLPTVDFSPFAAVDFSPGTLSAEGRAGHRFVGVGENPYEAVRLHALDAQQKGKRVVLATYSPGSQDRLTGLLRDHGMVGLSPVETWNDAVSLSPKKVPVIVLGLDHGFETPDLVILSEADILGDRLARPAKKKRQADSFIRDATALSEGDLVVHVEHGIGRYDGLETLFGAGAPHDCLRVIYAGGDKLFLPVENIDVLSRFGSETAGVTLDRLGSPAWQARKAKLKDRIRDMASQLIQVAAVRKMKTGDSLSAPDDGLYDAFCAQFPYVETEDQLCAIRDTLDNMASGCPMDRLVCGDVGFGKTEVALRAAFVAAMSGVQVAVVVPTTLLARQHHLVFKERFADLPVQVAQLSRLVGAKETGKIKSGLADGSIDIVVGTHALVAKSIKFKRLGLLVIDEEQHFGVAHKERLKQLKTDVHVLTLSATPIPRTLQLALSGVRELSIIATPPVDRLAVRTFVLPFDGVIIREALMRERYRGGQSFYVCPRLADLDTLSERLATLVPEVKTVMAHGQMSATQLEEVMSAFTNGEYDVLLATNIIESGLDMPRVNTIIIHRADMFGLGQLYQLRGRVGRGKQRSYAYLTVPAGRRLTPAAEKRLTVMQTLDTLGAGFSLASHDLDIRGAGNLLGDEQSGHIKEVGLELYQHLLEEAIAAARAGEGLGDIAEDWTPQIQLGMPVLIPQTYVKDLGVRLSLYRSIADATDGTDIENLAVALIDRFGPLPLEVKNLLHLIEIKHLCRTANVEKIDAGPKGCVLAFRGNSAPNPPALVDFISQNVALVKLRPDHKLVYRCHWEDQDLRIKGVQGVLQRLAQMAKGE